MNLRAFDLNLLTVFDAIYQSRNMSRAAERIGLSQPAMSLALGRLRHLLGDPLFIRRAGAMQPTARAQQIAGPIRMILDTVSTSLLRQSEFDYVSSKRMFELALGDYGACIVLPRLSQLLEELGASVELHVSGQPGQEAEDALSQGTLDLSLTFYPVAPRDLHAQLVYTDTLSVLARHGHPQMSDTLSIEQYCALHHVIGKWPEGRGLRPGEKPLFDRSLERHESVLVDSFMFMPAIIAGTDLIGTVPTRMAQHFADTYNLKMWSPPLGAGKASIYLNWHKSRDQDKGHVWIRNTIIDLFNRL